MIHISPKTGCFVDAMRALKTSINTVLVAHMHKADLRPSEMAEALQSNVESVRNILAYKIESFTVEQMLRFVMCIGYAGQTACNQDGQLTFTFEKEKK